VCAEPGRKQIEGGRHVEGTSRNPSPVTSTSVPTGGKRAVALDGRLERHLRAAALRGPGREWAGRTLPVTGKG
jgi:hypothetical protein